GVASCKAAARPSPSPTARRAGRTSTSSLRPGADQARPRLDSSKPSFVVDFVPSICRRTAADKRFALRFKCGRSFPLPARGKRRAVKRVAGWVAWYVVLWWLWLLLVGEWNREEWIAAALAAAAAATIGAAARSAAGAHAHVPPLRRLARAWSVPLF